MSIYDQPAKSILHPTDFSAGSESAFAHALAISMYNKAELTIIHAVPDREKEVPWHDYPAVRETLARWGHLDSGASRRDVAAKPGINVKKAVGFGKDVAKVIDSAGGIEHPVSMVLTTLADKMREAVDRVAELEN